MPDHIPDMQRMEDAFQQARRELAGISSIRPQVEQRIATLTPQPAPRILPWTLAASLIVVAFGTLLWWHLGGVSLPPDQSTTPTLAQDLTLKTGDTELFEHFAAIINPRAIIVLWSYRGPGRATLPAVAAESRAGKYRLRTLRETQLPDGRTFVCSLFIPDPGVYPILEPPSVYTKSADHGTIACSISPRVASTAELASVIQSAGINGKSEFNVADIEREIQQQTY